MFKGIMESVVNLSDNCKSKKKVNVCLKKKCVQGKNANSSGKKLENFVEDTLINKGVFSIRYSHWKNKKIVVPKFVDKVLYKQVPYVKLWGGENYGYTDFVLKTSYRKVRIDVRSQQVSGSVEEKVPYLFLTAERCYAEQEVVIVLDGPGVKPEIRKWLIDMANSVKHKTIKVFDKEQFKAWVDTI